MAAPRPWMPAEEVELRERHAAGESLHSIAKVMGRSKPVLSRHAKSMGLTWDRSQTAAATVAHVVDAKARRAVLELRALARVEALYDRLDAPTFKTITRGVGGEELHATLDYVPARDERDLAVTIRTHLDASLRINAHEAAGAGATAVIGILQQTAAALGITDYADTTT
jgi:hypothetical protein